MAFDFEIFWSALTSWAFFKAACWTVVLAVAAHAAAIVLATPMALVLERPSGLAKRLVRLYVGIFRGAPTLLQLLFVWNVLPQISPVFREPWFTPFLAAWIALTLNEAAYQVEINRSALGAVDREQSQAAAALGLTRLQTYVHVVFPQAYRVGLPPTVNEFISLLKATSLASVISFQELMTTTSQAVATTFQFLEYYSVALVYYLTIVYILMWIQGRLEARMRWTAGADGREAPAADHR